MKLELRASSYMVAVFSLSIQLSNGGFMVVVDLIWYVNCGCGVVDHRAVVVVKQNGKNKKQLTKMKLKLRASSYMVAVFSLFIQLSNGGFMVVVDLIWYVNCGCGVVDHRAVVVVKQNGKNKKQLTKMKLKLRAPLHIMTVFFNLSSLVMVVLWLWWT